ncbi:Uncharacterised protein [Slackia heliotrinireducens]|uniref:DUF4064 domain-containing protein n=1 Tax=Slackia heliotrinireducens (strain ATCC 29202 / DSM 20476 / NCTC 11029 / RHS 1) TaxID=471855 RepID=C7N721_SLAHD|nr:DUF4064 domain-containing protein [Slackia heliotrinireducens]ACV22706.1 hypothetical protein Shel_16870 [Slackia heliotrinireducens DSM 20476]VEH01318.1 Uncharacterised protein [Slackia heliotrinireducens]
MEVQIPLVIFTSFLAWAAGSYATQCILAFKGKARSIQQLAIIVSVVILAVGGIAVTFHLTHLFNIFKGFGHLSSGITQELIAIVLMVVVMLIHFLMVRRSESGDTPKWVAVAGVLVSLVLIVAMGHSYMMPARPAWDSVLQLLSLLGAACILGPATVAVLAAVKGEQVEELGMYNLIGTAANAVLAAAYLGFMQVASSSLQSFAYYFDPTHPNYALKASADVSIFSGSALPATVIAIVAIVVSLLAVFMGKKDGNWKLWGAVIVAAGLVCAFALRVVMYVMGASLFMIY